MNKIFIILAVTFNFTLQAELFFTPEMIATHIQKYTEEEIHLINKDLDVVRSVCFGNLQNTEHRFYLATAGAPGSRKTTILERFVSNHPKFQGGVYLDPDPRTLKFMVHTYYATSLNPLSIATIGNYDEIIKNAYEKWRGGSNYICLTLLEESFALGRSVIHGTTSTGSHVPDFFAKLKENHYEIILLLCACPDEVRFEAIDYRNRVVRFYQSSNEDAVAKGKLFLQKMDSYFAYADKIYFFWSDSLFSTERLAAVWSEGKFEIHDQEAMDSYSTYFLGTNDLKQ
jgi:hypothetical protein